VYNPRSRIPLSGASTRIDGLPEEDKVLYLFRTLSPAVNIRIFGLKYTHIHA
jgi:hypothetical protein